MNMFKWILSTLLMFSFCSFGQPIHITEEQSKKADEIVFQFKSPFVKFTDGSVSSIRKAVLTKMGIQFPKIGNNTNKWSWRIISLFKVEDSDLEGCRINPVNKYGDYYNNKDDLDIFIEGFAGYSGRLYGPVFLKRSDEDYTYKTVLGNKRIIPKYECGIPATEQEYRKFLTNNK